MALPSSTSTTTPITVDPKLHLPASTDPPSDINLPTQKVWLIYGATGHVGRSLVKIVLTHGDNVTAVGRTSENTVEQMQGWHAQCHGLLCDVRIRETVEAVMSETIKRWGRVDIIVNCTGYGVIGACEDQDDYDLRSQFDTNFMGTLNIIQLSLPYFREQASKRENETDAAGRYIIFSSTSGALGVPGLGPYCATKYAVEGLIESMLYEVDSFGIKATLVEPGHMRLENRATTPQNGAAVDEAESTGDVKLQKYGHFLIKKPSAPYDTPTAPAGHARRIVQWLVDRQPTSAVRSAELVWQLGHCRYPPLRLLLGTYAIDSIRDRLRSIVEEIEDWKHLAFPSSEETNQGGKQRIEAEGQEDGDRDEDDEMEDIIDVDG